MKTKVTKFYIIVFCICNCYNSYAQDFHVSQYETVPVYSNASATGMFDDAKFRVNTLLRSQWASFAGKPFTTMFLAYDRPVNERFGAGGYLLRNEASNGYTDQQIVLSGAYRITNPSNRSHWLTVGLQAGIIYKAIREDYVFDSQYQSGTFDNSMPDFENLESNAKLLPEFNMGIAYAMKDENKTVNPFIYGSMFHITAPDESFTDEQSELPRRFLGNTGCTIQMNEAITVIPSIMYMNQGASSEYKAGVTGRWLINDTEGLSLLSGLHYRLGDAVILGAGLEYKEFAYHISYDFNVSDLQQYSNNRGAVELGIQFKKDSRKGRRR